MNIKRIFASALPAALLACLTCATSACGGKGKNVEQSQEEAADSLSVAESASFVTDSIVWNDSVVSPAKNKAVCSISLAYPVAGGKQLVDSVRKWIANQLSPSISNQPDSITEKNTDFNDGRKLTAFIGTEILANLKNDLSAFDDLDFDEPRTLEYSAIVSPLWVTTSTITYGCSTYTYLGGAHGGAGFSPAVFNRSNGDIVGWNMFPASSRLQLTQMVKEGLMKQYFEVSTTNDFRDALLVNPDTLPLPVTPPYFMPDGVHFDYQQYEIAPYAAGMPSCVLPYSEVRPLMTAAAAALLPTEE